MSFSDDSMFKASLAARTEQHVTIQGVAKTTMTYITRTLTSFAMTRRADAIGLHGGQRVDHCIINKKSYCNVLTRKIVNTNRQPL